MFWMRIDKNRVDDLALARLLHYTMSALLRQLSVSLLHCAGAKQICALSQIVLQSESSLS